MNNDLNEIENIQNKNKKKVSIKLIILFVVLFIFLLVALFIGFRLISKKNTVTFEDYNLYQYYSGIRYDYKGTVTIYNDGKLCTLTTKDITIEDNNMPIYFQDKNNMVFFPINMSIIIPREINKTYKLNYFTKISCELEDETETCYLMKKDTNDVYLEESFLYDGRDTYFFLYGTKLTIDGKEYILSPLSYATVNYKDQIEIYDKKEDKYIIIEKHDKDVISDNDNYKINLSTDMIFYGDTSRMLVKNISNFPVYK